MVVERSDWRYPIIKYLQEETLPEEKEEATRLKRTALHYAMIGDKLYKRGFSTPPATVRRRHGVQANHT
jgi:hypothetical protein